MSTSPTLPDAESGSKTKLAEILDVIIESCPTKIFPANPDMDRDLYRHQFNLNENEIELISTLRPKQQLLIKTPNWRKLPISKWTRRAIGSTPTIRSTTGSAERHLRCTGLKRV